MKLLKNGSRGSEVTVLQGKLNQLGFGVEADGIYGEQTHKAIVDLQSMFGYTVDGIVGEGTVGLIDAQIGYGWNVNAPDAQEKALRAQGKDPEKHLGKMSGKADAGKTSVSDAKGKGMEKGAVAAKGGSDKPAVSKGVSSGDKTVKTKKV